MFSKVENLCCLGSEEDERTEDVSKRCYTANCEDGRGVPRAKRCEQPLQSGKGKEVVSPLGSLERNAALLRTWF